VNPARKAAFIDRDGVINEERAFVHRIEDFVFLPGVIDALRALQAAGYLLVVITNQSGIARGFYGEDDYLKLTDYMREQLRAAGITLDSVQHCPHLPTATVERFRVECDCRKPNPGMLLSAIRELNIDAAESVLVGDRGSDIEAGRGAGVGRCYLVRTGYELTAQSIRAADGVYDDLAACARQLLAGKPVSSGS
jgi:D,D-heptose 1,7-bisphosphate phosphatase